MKSRLLVSYLVALCLAFVFAGSAWAASAVIKPDQLPNGATDTPSNNVIHARLEVTLTGAITLGAGEDLTITLPSEVTIKTSTTARSYTQGATAQADKAVFVARSSSTATVVASIGTVTTTVISVDITNGGAAGEKLIFEMDLTTPANITSPGATTFTLTFPNSTADNTTAAVTKKQNSQLTFITFSEPTLNNDTTLAEGTGFKITFPATLPDLVHDDNTKSTGSTANPNGANTSGTGGNSTDDFDDMIYRFWASTDSTLTKVGSGATRLNVLEMKRVPTSVTNATLSTSLDKDAATDYTATPSGLVQIPVSVDESIVTELFTTRFADANLEGLVDTRGLAAGKWFIYVSSDKTADFFLGRSGRLVVKHSPGFLAAAWDGDQTGDFSTNSIVENTVDAASLDDAYNLTLDSGQLFSRTGAQASSEIASATADFKTDIDLAFVAVDYDNPTADIAIFVSTNSGLTTNEMTTTGSSITGLTGARLVAKSDTLTTGARRHNFKPEDKISVLGTDTTFVAAGSYTVYFAAFDGTNKTLEKASDLSATLTKTVLSLTVKHSPQMNVDPEAFDSGSADQLRVNTGVTVATATPQRSVRISWEQNGLDGVKSVEVTPTIDLFYSTSAAYTTAASIKADVGIASDTHKITKSSAITLSNKAKFQNHFDWDLWTYTSAEGTVPASATNYSIYAIVKAGSTERLARFHNPTGPVAKTVRFTHDSYVQPVLPAKDVTVGPDDPVVFTWNAADVDNAGGTAGATGLSAPNGTSTSPDLLIILSSADVGATTTYGALSTVATNYVANSRDGDDGAVATTTGIVRLKEGVDTSFVFSANQLSTTITGAATVIPAGTYTAYIMINGKAISVGAAPFMTSADVARRMPGKIILTSAGGSITTVANSFARFVFPTQISASSGELVRIPIVAEDATLTVGQANIYVSVDTTYFEPVDKNPAQAGTQPYTLGTNSALSSSKVVGNTAIKSGNKWLLDFIYADASTGFTFLDGFETLANLHLKARDVSGTINTTVTLDNDPSASRQTSLYLTTGFGGTRINTTLPGPSSARIDSRGSISGTVVLQGRASYAMPAAEVTFFLRLGSLRGSNITGTANQAGGFDTLTDSDFIAANDSTTTLAGVQKALPATGAFTLSKVPAGDYTLVVFVDRYLAGQREVSVKPAEAVTGIQPTLNGLGQEKGQLLAGDAAGYDHDNLASTNTRPDNFIDASDQNAISAAIFAVAGDSLYKAYPFTDVNGSGRVDGVDLNFATVNATTINGTNDPVKPTFNLKPVAPNGNNANAAFILAAAPPAVKAGETFDVAVQVKGAVAARAYEFHLGYDPSKVAPEGVVATGDLLARYGVALAQRDLVGDYGVTGSAYSPSAAASGDGGLATVRFRAIQGGPTAISILDGFLIDSELNVEKPKMDARVALDVAAGPMKLHDASGAEIRGLITLDDAKVDFNDFFALAEAFGSKKDAANFNPLADLNEDGAVDFNDFFIFAENFGKVAVDAPAAKRSSKPIGANPQGTLSLTALSGAVKPGQTVTLDAVLSGAAARGVGFAVTYDPARFEFVEAARSGEELFLARPDGEGRVAVARAAEGGLDGSVARLVFRAKGEFEEPGRFQIADGLVLGADGLIARVAPGGALNLATTPTTFAMFQNFPNPFNPETTIKYNLADDAQVHLRIYNILGQVVRTLVQERQAAGRYAIRWDGRDDRGLTVSSGIYFYQITAGKFKDVRKLMLLK